MEVHKVGFPFLTLKERLKKAGLNYEVEGQPKRHIGLWLIQAKKTN